MAGSHYFGVAADSMALGLDEIHLRWFQHWLKGEDTGMMDEPPVKIFVMGDDVWRDEDDWPLARARNTSYYLRSGGNANTRHGDGELSPVPPSDESPDVFLYNPANPVPTQGGPLCCNPYFVASGALDQSEIEARPDVLVYSTPGPGAGRRGHRPGHPHPVGRHLGHRHRLHRQAGRRLRVRLCPQLDRRHHPRPLSRVHVRSVPGRAGPGPIATPSTCGPPATCSRLGTAYGWRSPAVTSPASTATPTPVA